MTKNNKRFYVYVYRDARLGKERMPFYVGKGKDKRAYSHLKPRIRKHNRLLSNIIQKHRALGLEPTIKIVGRFATEAEAFVYEVALIAKYGRRDVGTGTLANHTDGGEGVSGWHLTMTPKQRRAFSAARSVNAHKLRKDPIFFATLIAGIEARWSNPKNHKAQSVLLKTLHKDPKYRKALYAGNAAYWNEKNRKKKSRELKHRHQDPKYRAFNLAQLATIRLDPEWRARRSKWMRQLQRRQVLQRRRQRALKNVFDNPQLSKRRNAKISATASRRQRDANGRFIPNQKRHSQ